MTDDFFNKIIGNVYNNNSINYFIKIEGWKNLNSDKIEKLTITILNKKTNKQKILTVKNDNFDLKIKLRNILVELINKKFISKDDTVAFVFDNFFIDEYPFGILVMKVSNVIYRIAKYNLAEYMDTNLVLEKVIDICEEIRKEGREGKMIGTLFVIGEEEELNPYLSQLVLNPFYGYSVELRDIINNDLNETIKEYSQLDGCFIINNKGLIISAGTYINIDTSDIKKYHGWGTKHLTASAITTYTKSIAVLVSESGNRIKIFKNGKLILKY